MSQRKKYSAEFKAEAVELVRSSSTSASQIARDIGVGPTLLNRWCREADDRGKPAFQGTGTPRDQELAALKRELAKTRKERDFLRDAAAFFAKGSS